MPVYFIRDSSTHLVKVGFSRNVLVDRVEVKSPAHALLILAQRGLRMEEASNEASDRTA